jgi:hypothetical protein
MPASFGHDHSKRILAMSSLHLPEPVAAYFAADAHGAAAVADCFSPDAFVKDEGQVHQGLAAIRAWKAAASTTYKYAVQPCALESEDSFHTVIARVTGDFPGSPVDLRYRFRLEGGLVASLEIAP